MWPVPPSAGVSAGMDAERRPIATNEHSQSELPPRFTDSLVRRSGSTFGWWFRTVVGSSSRERSGVSVGCRSLRRTRRLRSRVRPGSASAAGRGVRSACGPRTLRPRRRHAERRRCPGRAACSACAFGEGPRGEPGAVTGFPFDAPQSISRCKVDGRAGAALVGYGNPSMTVGPVRARDQSRQPVAYRRSRSFTTSGASAAPSRAAQGVTRPLASRSGSWPNSTGRRPHRAPGGFTGCSRGDALCDVRPCGLRHRIEHRRPA